MKLVATSILILFYLSLSGQPLNLNVSLKESIQPFELSLMTYNHSSRIYEGYTTYLLKDDSIFVKKQYFGDSNSSTIFASKLANSTFIATSIAQIGIDSLADYYCNFCIMPTSGNEYYLRYNDKYVNKEIHLHHYYLKELDVIIQMFNSIVPDKYLIRYLSKSTKQDCIF